MKTSRVEGPVEERHDQIHILQRLPLTLRQWEEFCRGARVEAGGSAGRLVHQSWVEATAMGQCGKKQMDSESTWRESQGGWLTDTVSLCTPPSPPAVSFPKHSMIMLRKQNATWTDCHYLSPVSFVLLTHCPA